MEEFKELSEISGTQTALKLISTSLCIAITLSTTYDIFNFLFQKPANQLLKCFSLLENAKNLFDTKEDKNSITSIHGIRSICTFCIMTQHWAYFRAQSPFVNQNILMDFALSLQGEAIAKLTGAVDSFLVISGALLTRASFKSLERNNFSKSKIIFQRFFSMTPCLTFIMLIDDVLTRSAIKSSGDLPILDSSVKNCWKYWWTVLLHFQNYYNPTDLCTATSWYLDVDFQMFLVSPFLIFLLWKFQGKFVTVILGLILTSCLIGFKTSIDYELVVRDYHFGNQRVDDPAAFLIYLPTHIRGMPFLVGIVLGYFIYRVENLNLQKPKVFNKVFTILSLYIFTTPVTTLKIDYGRSLLPNALYIAFGRFLWAAATAWIIYSCHVGLNNSINKFLSHKFWIPFGRMGLSVYLVHPVIYRFHAFQEKEKVSFNFEPVKLFSEILLILASSIAFYLIIQEPTNLVTKYFIGKFYKNKK